MIFLPCNYASYHRLNVRNGFSSRHLEKYSSMSFCGVHMLTNIINFRVFSRDVTSVIPSVTRPHSSIQALILLRADYKYQLLLLEPFFRFGH